MLQRPNLLAALIKYFSQHVPHSFPVVLDCSTLVASVSEVFANIIMNLQKEDREPEKVIGFIVHTLLCFRLFDFFFSSFFCPIPSIKSLYFYVKEFYKKKSHAPDRSALNMALPWHSVGRQTRH